MKASARSNAVPKAMQAVYDAIVVLIDEVCDRHLNAEYRDMAHLMTATLCRKRPSPLASGQPKSWACSIVYVIGRINFLSDSSASPHMSTAQLCAAFGIGESTVYGKARVIEQALATRPFDPTWTLPTRLEKNPMVWMLQVNGLLVDVRHMPREVQETAFDKGMIPYIPADCKTR